MDGWDGLKKYMKKYMDGWKDGLKKYIWIG